MSLYITSIDHNNINTYCYLHHFVTLRMTVDHFGMHRYYSKDVLGALVLYPHDTFQSSIYFSGVYKNNLYKVYAEHVYK